MPRPDHFSFWNAWRTAVRGLLDVVRSQRNLRIELAVAPLTLALSAWLEISRADWLWVIACIGAVLAAELLNTSLEAVVDLASPEHHELARQAKDIAAAAVLVTALTSALIGGIVLGVPLWQRLTGS